MPSEGEPIRNETPEAPPVIAPPVIGEDGAMPAPRPPESAEQSVSLKGRLHPFTLVIILISAIKGFLIPAVIVFYSGSKTGMGAVLLFFLGVTLVQGLFRYFAFTYRIENGELVTRSGVVEKRERRIPLGRVQDLRVEQGVIHRMLGVVDVHVETAGGRGAEASLSVLSRDEADNLRRAVFAQPRETAAAGATATAAEPVETPDVPVRRLGLGELIMAGLTSNRAASALVIIFAAWQLADDVLPTSAYERLGRMISGSVERFFEQGGGVSWGALALLLTGGVLLGAVISAAGSVILFHGFNLARRGEDLRRSYGIFTRRSSSLPRRRIQVLKIEETGLRRLFGLASIRADTAGGRMPGNEPQDGRDVLLPVVPASEVERILPEMLREWSPAPPQWNKVSPRAIRRETKKGVAACIVVALIVCAVERGYDGLWLLVLLPVIYGLNVLSYRHLGYAFDEKLFRCRRGWLGRSTHLAPVRNMQVLTVRDTPFDRRHGVATLAVDTAGQSQTGGGPRIDNVPRNEAERVARELARRAAELRFRW